MRGDTGVLNTPEVGRIIGEASSDEFMFVADRNNYPAKHEYLIVKSQEYVDGQLREVYVLSQVKRIVSKSLVLSEETNIETVDRIRYYNIDDVNVVGYAKILGFIVEKDGKIRVRMPRRSVTPGSSVYIAPSSLLRKFFTYPEGEGLRVGTLILRDDVPVEISINGLRRHLAILAQTGAGKSYTAGILIEELLDKGATIIVIDPHADYVFLSRTPDNSRYRYYDRITVFRNPNSTGRYGERDIDNLKEYVVKFSELRPYEIFEVAGIPERYSGIREVLRRALERLRAANKSYTPQDLYKEVERISSGEEDVKKELSASASRALKYLYRLTELRVFGDRSVPIEEILKPMHVSVIDLSGLEDRSMDYIAFRILTDVYDSVRTGRFPYPVFVFVEEAHTFVPPRRSGVRTFTGRIINTVASEGRKFGIFLILITQRPCKLDSDSLSQCNSQIVMKTTNPHDQNAIRQASERMSDDLLRDLPGLNPGEGIIVGEVTRIPVMVKFRRRNTREGGADIDVVEALKMARRDLKAEVELQPGMISSEV